MAWEIVNLFSLIYGLQDLVVHELLVRNFIFGNRNFENSQNSVSLPTLELYKKTVTCVLLNEDSFFFAHSTLKGNGITGEIPESIGNLSSLTSLDLEDNQLSGPIPSTLGNLKNIQFL